MTTGPTLSIKTDGHAEAKADAVVDAFADVRSSAWTPFLTLFRKEVVRFMKVWMHTVIAPVLTGFLYLREFLSNGYT